MGNEIYKNLSTDNIDNEVWMPISNSNIYEVSNMGRVKAKEHFVNMPNGGFRKHEERIMKQSNTKGYLSVTIKIDNKQKMIQVHTLVANAFCSGRGDCVNHKDENKKNNKAENLEWCSIKYNNVYGHRLEKARNSFMKNNRCCKKVIETDIDGNIINEYRSITDTANAINKSVSTVSYFIREHKLYNGHYYLIRC